MQRMKCTELHGPESEKTRARVRNRMPLDGGAVRFGLGSLSAPCALYRDVAC